MLGASAKGQCPAATPSCSTLLLDNAYPSRAGSCNLHPFLKRWAGPAFWRLLQRASAQLPCLTAEHLFWTMALPVGQRGRRLRPLIATWGASCVCSRRPCSSRSLTLRTWSARSTAQRQVGRLGSAALPFHFDRGRCRGSTVHPSQMGSQRSVSHCGWQLGLEGDEQLCFKPCIKP